LSGNVEAVDLKGGGELTIPMKRRLKAGTRTGTSKISVGAKFCGAQAKESMWREFYGFPDPIFLIDVGEK
jgi:hypothetical protein